MLLYNAARMNVSCHIVIIKQVSPLVDNQFVTYQFVSLMYSRIIYTVIV